jgi:hypothetical protein
MTDPPPARKVWPFYVLRAVAALRAGADVDEDRGGWRIITSRDGRFCLHASPKLWADIQEARAS